MNRPRFAVPRPFGLCFAGNEDAYCSALDLAVSKCDGMLRYLEIGLGYGDTMRAAIRYLQNYPGIAKDFQGVDIEGCSPNALDRESYAHPVRIELSGASAFLAGKKATEYRPDFVFIDGCHGQPCVMSDFKGVEAISGPNTIVVFHDTDPGCQDIHFQPHCGTGIRARAAVEALGLLNNSRSGWRVLDETSGNKDLGGHGCLIVQRCRSL